MSQPGMTTDLREPSTPRSAQERLSVFAGRWKTTGKAYDSPLGSRADISAVQTYAWLAGGRFLIHRLEGRLGTDEIACIEVIGHDAARDGYRVDSFYNDGKRNQWRLDQYGDTWTLTGDWEAEGESLKVRCTLLLDASHNGVMCRWEHSSDEGRWQTFWDTCMTRA